MQRVLFVAFLSYVKIFVPKSTGLDACTEEIKMFSIHFGHVFKNNSAKHKWKQAKMSSLEKLPDAWNRAMCKRAFDRMPPRHYRSFTYNYIHRSLGMPPLCSQLLPSAVPWPVMWKVLFLAPLKIVSGQCEYQTVIKSNTSVSSWTGTKSNMPL